MRRAISAAFVVGLVVMAATTLMPMIAEAQSTFLVCHMHAASSPEAVKQDMFFLVDWEQRTINGVGGSLNGAILSVRARGENGEINTTSIDRRSNTAELENSSLGKLALGECEATDLSSQRAKTPVATPSAAAAAQASVSLVCRVWQSSQPQKPLGDLSFAVDLAKATVNGRPAQVSDGAITWQDSTSDGSVSTTTINRYTLTFQTFNSNRSILSGDCTKVTKRQF